MKAVLSFVALLSPALAVSSSLPSGGAVTSCAAADRVLIETRNVTVAGHEIQVSTKACSGNINIISSRSFKKRQTDVCGQTADFECAVGSVTPVIADCASLQAALPDFIATQPPFFVLAPQTVEEVSLRTCLFAWINNNAVGGASLEGCWSDVERIGGAVPLPGCFGVQGFNAQIAFPSLAMFEEAWVFEATGV
ncbi:hypothetical protein GGX14DRAFT_443126 [Mycena pura]|uniref:Uncharacterized protein n=1 Tax=Mycena pura TaxID=153505 RepID=A0AAD6VKI9_9AGAR|nr:hypothetical protein GGX14DRAFT_443126 [Mycena pura]